MKALALTNPGIEDIASLEIKELIKSYTDVRKSCVIFEYKKISEIALLCYKAQSIKKILFLLSEFKINSLEDLQNSVKEKLSEIKKYLKVDKTFAVQCEIIDNDNFDRDDVCIETADSIEIDSKVNLDNPDVIIFVYIYKNDCYLGIDFSGTDLSKRDYRIYVHHESLKATLAYSLLRIAEYKKSELLLDPFCGSGTILIEAALFSNNFSQNYYSKDKFAFLKFFDVDLDKFDSKSSNKFKIIGYDSELRHVIAAKKNAKIAGIEKSIKLTKVEIRDLDLKLGKNTVDKIITNPPNKNHRNERIIPKLYNLFFKQASVVLKDKGTVTLITKTFDLIKEYALKNQFKIIIEKDLVIGKVDHKIIIFGKTL